MQRAMILAAGFGTRLRPLTEHTPKPLLPVGGRPLIDRILQQLKDAGLCDIVINLHHHPEQIRRHIGNGSQYGVEVTYSEEQTILGTGGGIKQAASFFQGKDFLVINGDIVSDIDLRALIAAHTDNAVSTLAIRTLHQGESYTPLDVGPDGTLRGFGRGTHHYTGIMIGTSRLLDQLPPEDPSELARDGWQPLLAHGARIRTYTHTGYWNDIGTPERYAAAHQYMCHCEGTT